MKKIWLFLSLLICSTLVAGCFKILDWDWMEATEDTAESYLQVKCIEHITRSFMNNWEISQSPFVYEFYKNSWTNNFIRIDYENLWIIEDYPNLWNLIWFRGYIEVNSSNLTNNRSYYLCEITEKWVIINIRFYDPNQYTAQDISQLHKDLINHTNAVPVPSEIEILKQYFQWDIIDWKVDKESLTLQPSNISFNVEWDDTLYYLNEFWIALVLWEDWKWWKVENAYEWKNLASVWLKKSWNRTYWFFLIDNKYFHTWQENPQPDEELVWENNKYHIVMRTVNNWGKDWSFDLVIYDVE